MWLGFAIAACLVAQDREAKLGEIVAKDIRRRTEPAGRSIQEYVRQVAVRVVPDAARWSVEAVVGEVAVGPLAIHPPGHLFVPVRVLALARSEAELAGVIAYAVAGGGQFRVITPDRPAESARPEPASRAAEMLAAAGYNPRALADYISRVEKWRNVQPPEMPPGHWIENTSAFVDAQARVRALDPARPPRQPSLLREKR